MIGSRVAPVGFGLAVALAAASAHAEQRVVLEVVGSCPSRSQVERALAAEGIDVLPSAEPASAPPPAEVWVWSDRAAAATIEIGHAGASELHRSIQGADCAAIADTFALIASSHLTSRAPAPRVAAASPEAELAPPGVITRVARPVGRSARRIWLALGATLDRALLPDDDSASLVGEIGATLRRGWAVRLVVARDRGTSFDDTVRRQTSGRLELLRRAPNQDRWLAPALGAGVAVSSVQTTTGWPVQVTRLHPIVTGGLIGGYAIARWLVVRAELGCQLFPIADSYTTETDGEIGESPRVIASFGVTAEIGIW